MNNIEKNELKPLSLVQSFIWFGSFTAIVIFSVYGINQFLAKFNLSEFEKFFIVIAIPMVLAFFTAIIMYKIENKNFKGFFKRYRMDKFCFKDVLWGFIIAIIAFLGFGIISLISSKLISIGVIPIPKNLSLMLDPNVNFNHETFNALVGGEIIGNWKVIIIYFIVLFFNIAGEELLWRGYILPRQELTFGKKTWLIHGLMWTAFHCFKWWEMINLLPICLSISFISQKRKSIWPGFIAHYLINGMSFIVFILAVCGCIQ